jgi:hypothetical protein
MAVWPSHSHGFWVVADAALVSMCFPVARVEVRGRPAAVGDGALTATAPAMVRS